MSSTQTASSIYILQPKLSKYFRAFNVLNLLHNLYSLAALPMLILFLLLTHMLYCSQDIFGFIF